MLLYLTTISARSSSDDEMLCVLKGQNTNLKYPSVFLFVNRAISVYGHKVQGKVLQYVNRIAQI